MGDKNKTKISSHQILLNFNFSQKKQIVNQNA